MARRFAQHGIKASARIHVRKANCMFVMLSSARTGACAKCPTTRRLNVVERLARTLEGALGGMYSQPP
eukprot:4195903-Amphidinium_carterae.1